MNDTLFFAGRPFSDFYTYIDGSKAFGSPEKDVEFIDIPGRNGSLSISNNRFNDISIAFPCLIRQDFVENYRQLVAFLNAQNGFQELSCTTEPNVFRTAQFTGTSSLQTTGYNIGGLFTVNFRCHPQRWLTSGQNAVEFTTDGTIDNPTLFESKPLIRIYGAGSVMIGNVTITVSANEFEYIDIDCETMNASYIATNANAYVSVNTYDLLTLSPGDNGITLTGVDSVEITPRWYEI